MDTRFVSGIEDNTRKSLIELLNARLADMIDLSHAVKQAHWNLKGAGFIGVHELLDGVYDRVNESADMMAERAVIIGGVAKGTSQDVVSNTKMKAYPNDITDIEDHVKALTERFADVGQRIRQAIEEASEAGDADTEDLFTEVSRQIDKDAWFIGANTKK